MNLMLTAEQFAQAAAVAAAQYYANAAAMNVNNATPISSSAPQQGQYNFLTAPPPPPPPVNLAAYPAMYLTGEVAQVPPAPNISHQKEDEKRRSKSPDQRDKDRRDRRSRRDRSRSRNRSRSRDRTRRTSRERSRRRSRDRSRDRQRRRDRSRDRSRGRDRKDSDEESNAAPNNTIMVRGLAQHLTENDLRDDITNCGLVARDVRLIRKKETGASRGFAFVEFSTVEEAKMWMDAKQGVLLFKDQYRAVMQYSIPRDGRPGDPPKVLHDWICSSCGVQNFRRRDQCFKCNTPKLEIEEEGADEISPHPTSVLLLRGLDALTTEETVQTCLQTLTQYPIKSVKIGRDDLTHTSRCVCYVEMNTLNDALFLHNQLLGAPPTIDEKLISVCFYKPPGTGVNVQANSAAAALSAAQWSRTSSKAAVYSEMEIERLADYSAGLYAKTLEEKKEYLTFYRNYYRNGGEVPEGHHGTVNVNGVDYTRYPPPDVSTYTYDQNSGYYFDPSTNFYYDASTQYYYNSHKSQYMYWSAEHQTYLPANHREQKETNEEEKSKDKDDKKDKVKSAKRIAKDMEKWAKTLNSKKDTPKVNNTAQPSTSTSDMRSNKSGAEDIAFSIFNRKLAPSSVNNVNNSGEGLAGLASYGNGSDSEEEGPSSHPSAPADESQFTDYVKLACLLCKRQFPSKDKLLKHNNVSDLHKQNLDCWRQKNRRSGSSSSASFSSLQYRDRAKERRQKYGEDEEIKPNKLKQKYMQAIDEVESNSATERTIDSSNIGNKMLQKMGWKEGLGLGRANQGRTGIIQAEQRNPQAGLGSAPAFRPGDSYKEALKKTLYQRYQDMN